MITSEPGPCTWGQTLFSCTAERSARASRANVRIVGQGDGVVGLRYLAEPKAEAFPGEVEQAFEPLFVAAFRRSQMIVRQHRHRSSCAIARTLDTGDDRDCGSILIGGEPLDPARSYRVVSNDFVFGGGDAFTAATEATDPVDAGADSDVLIEYLMKHSPVAPGPQNRITRR